MSQGDGPDALASYREALAIREALAAHDSSNTLWQIDVAASCGKLGALKHGQSIEVRHAYLVRGKQILVSLKNAGRLSANQDWIAWFDEQLEKLAGNM